MSTAVSDTVDKRVEPTSRKEEERRQVTRIPRREMRRNEAREVATVISRSEKPRVRFVVRLEAGQMHLAFYQDSSAPLSVSAHPPAPNRLDNLRIYCRRDTTSISMGILVASRLAFPRAFASLRA